MLECSFARHELRRLVSSGHVADRVATEAVGSKLDDSLVECFGCFLGFSCDYLGKRGQSDLAESLRDSIRVEQLIQSSSKLTLAGEWQEELKHDIVLMA